MIDVRDNATALLRDLAGHAPLGLWSAPGRVNLIGEHTDYNEGFVLPFAIDRRTVIAVGPRNDGLLRVASTLSEGAVEVPIAELPAFVAGGRLQNWTGYVLGVAWALGEAGADLGAVPGFDIAIDSNIPVGAGISSSAAVECAVAVALNELWQVGLSRPQLADVGRQAENEAVGAPTGIMDQSASLLGRQDSAVFLDCRSLEATVVDLAFAPANLSLLVIDTGVKHSHATGGYRARRDSCVRGAATLGVPALRDVAVADLDRAGGLLDEETFHRVRHIVTENKRVLDTVRTLRERGPRAIGELLDASHTSMRDDFEISAPELDLAVETARANGAIGARMTGGGFGGAAIALIPSDEVSRVRIGIDGAFAERGFATPETFTVAPSDGAKRE